MKWHVKYKSEHIPGLLLIIVLGGGGKKHPKGGVSRPMQKAPKSKIDPYAIPFFGEGVSFDFS